MHGILAHRQSLRNFCNNYDHHAQCLSPIQVAPRHVNKILTMGMEKVKSENSDLKGRLVCLIST